ncbi:BatA domain-containing protein [Mucilaginibacter sp. L3T2-6]|uniref:BatA domain-containing protein n=1 Tax=Mucilaginibacter sp. L3T2-6 TaxID=3062491 RepID=UPI0026752406|nr:BatA domain-containing protein [Mucilaginibacter sp. L3T2-6]MDO3645215.1 BatA domain-containing protein [Mucilaginibacter sp. L3T2-6]MDV6217652.1 BatA domain-containing protein [Mucilaginibacter sp. L3T2-6]
MHFLYPAFLLALFTLAIPVIIHLFNFRRYQKVYFSNVQFLKDVQEQQSHRRNLKERLILASRLLALAFLVLAFARPYIPGRNAANAGKQQAVSIFVDNSYSMQALNREGSLLDEAKRRAKEIASAYSINDSFQLLTQDFEGSHQRLLSRDEFNDAVDAVKISPQSRTLQQIISRQESLLDMNKSGVRSVYVISDFQKNMAGGQPLKKDTGVRVTMVRLSASSLPNVAVDSVSLLSAIHRPGETEKLVVRLHNYSGKSAEKVPLKLTINGEQKALGSYTVDARSAQYDTLTFSGLKPGWQRAELTLQDNPVTFDNEFHFAFNAAQQMPLLLVNGGTPNPYLKAVFAADPFFNAKQVPDGNVDYSSLNSYPLIVLSDIDAISTGLSQQLKTYVSKGGTLVVFPSASINAASYQSLLQPLNAAWPGALLTENTKVYNINLQSQVFKGIFEGFPQNPELPLVKKYYMLSSAIGNRTENLMTLPGNKTFWAGYTAGKGHVYVSAVPLSEDFSNLPRHALFVPVMFRIALLSGHDLPLFYTLGKDENIEVPPVHVNEKQLLKLVKGGQSVIPDTRQQEGSTLLYVSDQLHETGIYDLKKGDSSVAVLAFNDNRSESDLSYLSNAQLAIAVPQVSDIMESGKASLKGNVTETNFGLQLWKLCIILALIFLAAEILLIRFYKTSVSNKNQPGMNG